MQPKSNPVLKPSSTPTTTNTAAVKQSTFIGKYQGVWREFDGICREMGIELVAISQQGADGMTSPSTQQSKQPRSKRKQITTAYPLIRLYRQICQHYALAKQRHYSPQLVAQLHQRVMVGHQLIYQGKSSYIQQFLNFIFYGFPARLRQHTRLFWLAFALFYLPLVLMMIGCYLNPELIYSVMSPDQVAEMEYMYNPANSAIGRSAERMSDTDMMMFGHYIRNNISIDFQMYASGLFLGIGTVLMTLYNGVVIGAVSGHLTQLGFGERFWSFVCGHGSFELTAAVIASAAGLRLAQPLIAPFPHRRKDAFIVAGKQSIQMLLGAAMMTFLAAFIEAFWSSSSVIPNGVKYAVAAVLWLLVGYYLVMAGRGYSPDTGQFEPIDSPDQADEVPNLQAAKPFTASSIDTSLASAPVPNHGESVSP